MRLTRIIFTLAPFVVLAGPEPAAAQVSALGTCVRLLDTDPATPRQGTETCFLEALSGVDQNGNIVSYEAVASVQLLQGPDGPLGDHDAILRISASGFVPVGEEFGRVVLSGSDGNPCQLTTDVSELRETICRGLFSFDGVFTAEMRIENFVDPD
jgi:hypothetical protein